MSLCETNHDFVEHHDEEAEPTSEAELLGWVLYGLASSGTSVFQTFVGPLLLNTMARIAAHEVNPLTMTLPGLGITAGSFSMLLIWVSVVLQLAGTLSLGALGDYGSGRKKLLIGTTVSGAVCCMLTLFCYTHTRLWLLGFLFIAVNVLGGLSSVFHGAYLPVLVRSHPRILALSQINKSETVADVTSGLSARSTFAGYSGMIILQFFCVLILRGHGCDTPHDMCPEFQQLFWPCLCIAFSGAWWLAISAYTFDVLEVRPAPALPAGQNLLTFWWRWAWCTLCELSTCYKQTGLFLLSYAFYIDALSTINHCAMIICKEILHMTMSQLLFAAMLASLGGMVGISLAGAFQKHYQVTTMGMLRYTLMGYILESSYLCCNLFDSIPFGLKHVFEVYSLSLVHGLLMGSANSYSRALCAELTPKYREASIASFYALAATGSCWVGPLIVFLVHNFTGSYSKSFPMLAALFMIGFLVLLQVDAKEGFLDATNISHKKITAASVFKYQPENYGSTDSF